MRVLDQKAFWVWGGIATLTLMCIYMTIGSGFVAVRTGLGMTELEFLNWWPMRVMAGVLAVTLVMVHRWIPLSWESLGVWMVHGGVLVLLAGSVWYFSQKTEGMVRIYLNKSVGEYEDIYSGEGRGRELPVEVKLMGFEAVKYPGAMDTYLDFVSTLEFRDKKTGAVKVLKSQLNSPAMSHGFGFFQTAWDGHDDASAEDGGGRFTVLIVTNRSGLKTMLIGTILVFVGIGYAFYVKPMLLRTKTRHACSDPALRGGGEA